MEKKIMTVAQASEYLQLHTSTVLKLLNEGRLPGTKLGRLWRVLIGPVEQQMEDNLCLSEEKETGFSMPMNTSSMPNRNVDAEYASLLEPKIRKKPSDGTPR